MRSPPVSQDGRSGVHNRVKNIRDQVRCENHHSGEKGNRHYNRIVSGQHSIHGEKPKARPGENLLNDNRAAEEARDLHSDHGDDRDQCIPQCMAPDDRLPPDSLALCRPQIVLAQNFQHGGPDIAQISAGHADRKRDTGKNKIPGFRRGAFCPERPHAARRQNAEPHGKHIDQKESQKEARDTLSEKGSCHNRIVAFLMLMNRRKNTADDGDHHAEQQRGAGQHQRRSEMRPDLGCHRFIVLVGISEIAVADRHKPVPVLHYHRFIQAHALGSPRQHGIIDLRAAAHDFDRIPDERHDQKIDDRDPPQHDKGDQNPLENIFCHQAISSPAFTKQAARCSG